MTGVKGWWAVIASVLCGVALAAAPAALQPLAHSALITLEGEATSTGLLLKVRHSADDTPLAVTDLSVSVDGRNEVAIRRPDGSWFVPLEPATWHANAALQVIVAHDGVREVLDGRVSHPESPAPGAAGHGGLLHDHQQMAWWVLNIVVVLIAAIALSRRRS